MVIFCPLFHAQLLFSDLNSVPVQVESGGNQKAELVVSKRLSRKVVSRRLSREVVIPDDEGTTIGERLASSRSNC